MAGDVFEVEEDEKQIGVAGGDGADGAEQIVDVGAEAAEGGFEQETAAEGGGLEEGQDGLDGDGADDEGAEGADFGELTEGLGEGGGGAGGELDVGGLALGAEETADRGEGSAGVAGGDGGLDELSELLASGVIKHACSPVRRWRVGRDRRLMGWDRRLGFWAEPGA